MDNFGCPQEGCTVLSATQHGLDIPLSLPSKMFFQEIEPGHVPQKRSRGTAISRYLVGARKRVRLDKSNDLTKNCQKMIHHAVLKRGERTRNKTMK